MRTLAFGKYAALTLMVSVISLLSSCRNNDFDFEAAHGNLSESDVAYNDKFTELIGDIDPNHTWSTAQQSGVKVSIDIPGEHLLRIYTADPLTSTAFLLARYENIEGGTTHELKFDIPANSSSFHAVLDEGEKRISQNVSLSGNGSAEFCIGESSATRAEVNVNGNEWEDCPTVGTDEAWRVSQYVIWNKSKLTDKKIQSNQLVNFYITHIYKGTLSCYYTAKNHGIVYGPDQMNNLQLAYKETATITNGALSSSGWLHVNNFNNGQNTANGGSTLITNCALKDLAYHNSTDSRYHNTYTVIEGADIHKSLAGYYYVCFDFYADGENSNQQVDRNRNYLDWIIRLAPATPFTSGGESSFEPETTEGDSNDIPISWIIACEDLPGTNSDFDYNDIVFSVTHVAGSSKCTIKPLAAGGTMESYIIYKRSSDSGWEVASDSYNRSEIHQWISQNSSASHTTMLNTDINERNIAQKVSLIPSTTIDMGDDFSMSNFAEHFAVRVISNNSNQDIHFQDVQNITTESGTANAPRLFCVNSDCPTWQWMVERQPIYYHYTDFTAWASSQASSNSWYQTIETEERNNYTIKWSLLEESNPENGNNEVTPTQPTEEEREEESVNSGSVVVRDENNNIVNATATSIFVMEAHETKTFKFYDASGKEYTSVNFHFVVTSGGNVLQANGTKLTSNNTTKEDKICVVSAVKGNTTITSFSVKVKAPESAKEKTVLWTGSINADNYNNYYQLTFDVDWTSMTSQTKLYLEFSVNSENGFRLQVQDGWSQLDKSFSPGNAPCAVIDDYDLSSCHNGIRIHLAHCTLKQVYIIK